MNVAWFVATVVFQVANMVCTVERFVITDRLPSNNVQQQEFYQPPKPGCQCGCNNPNCRCAKRSSVVASSSVKHRLKMYCIPGCIACPQYIKKYENGDDFTEVEVIHAAAPFALADGYGYPVFHDEQQQKQYPVSWCRDLNDARAAFGVSTR